MAVGSAIWVHCFQLFIVAGEARRRAADVAAASDQVAPAPTDSLVAIVFSCFAAEAFINELGAVAGREHVSGFRPSTPDLGKLSSELAMAEARRDSTLKKFVLAHGVLKASDIDTGREPFQSFARLMELREWIAHSKPDRNGDGLGVPKALEALARIGLTYPKPPNSRMSGLDMMLTDKMADWACRSSLAMVRSTLALVPTASGSSNLDWLGNMFAEPAESLLGPAIGDVAAEG
jgi:hypothetical protein